jgi:hypothetical protein
MENRNGLMVGGVATRATGDAEPFAAVELLKAKAGSRWITVGADKAYDTANFVLECREENVTPHVAQNINEVMNALSAPLFAEWLHRLAGGSARDCARDCGDRRQDLATGEGARQRSLALAFSSAPLSAQAFAAAVCAHWGSRTGCTG